MIAAAAVLVTSFSAGPPSLAGSSWQAKLDRALLSVDASPQERLKDLQDVASRGPDVLQDVSSAFSSLVGKGFKDGHGEFLDTLFPEGTTARSDLEGLRALSKQIPEVELPPPQPGTAPPLPQPQELRTAASEVTTALGGLLTDREKQTELIDEALNAFRSTPKGLETPRYEVVRRLPGEVELRRYAPFSVARKAMARDALSDSVFSSSSGGEGFNSLAGYLFGKNADAAAMAMTTPVEISVTESGGEASMAFVLPDEVAEAPPQPLEGSQVRVERVPERLVAVSTFPGLVTDPEVARQREKIRGALDGTLSMADDGASYSVLQYNAPFTLPWRRRNEVAVVVDEEQGHSAAEQEEVNVCGVASWYDAGIRL
jgi:hypothetical protein